MVSLAGVVVGGFFAYKGNHIAKIQSEKNTSHERDLLRSNYQKISSNSLHNEFLLSYNAISSVV
jgi:hypothetical protein